MIAASVLLSLALGATGAFAESFEAADFNATQSLVDLGVDVGNIPDLSTFVERRSSNVACAAACITLSATFGRDAVLRRGDETYESFTGGYWSANQGELDPYCIFEPPSRDAVSVLVLLSRLTQCPFAVKSGGHAAFAGASSIEGGITVSLKKMNTIMLSCDRKHVRIGAGNTWADVYGRLTDKGLTVAGGRVSGVGVGGLSLGGGISFVSNLYGWASDNIKSYEVVTASGIVVTASVDENPSLYWALRGGGNNFGIVTSFVFETIPLPGGRLWGGTRMYLEHTFDDVAAAFSLMVADSPKDPNAGLWVAWLQNSGMKIAATELWYAKPDGGDAAIFDAFNAIEPLADLTQNRVLPEYTDAHQEGNPYGLREVYYGLTVKADPRIAKIARDIFFEELPATENVAGANPTLIFQAITEGQLRHMSKNGGNPLGLTVEDGPFYIMHIACWWADSAGDETVYEMISTVLTRITEKATALGVQNDYIYMNYASAFEHVIRSYGAENEAKLKKIAEVYDPTEVFQRLQPGHFKLDRAPVPDSGYFSGVLA